MARYSTVRRAAVALAACASMAFAAGPVYAAGPDWMGFDDGDGTPAAAPVVQDDPDVKALMATGPLDEKTLGKPGASVTIVEYASLSCMLCRAFHKTTFARFKREYIDTGKVYFVFREFPIGKSPAAAATAARCVPEKDFFRINDKLMTTSGQWDGREPNLDAIYKVVQETGISRSSFDTCMANQKISDGVVQMKQRGREFGVVGTPTFFINGKRVRGNLSFDEMRKLIDEHPGAARNPA